MIDSSTDPEDRDGSVPISGVASHVPVLAQNGPAQLGGVISLPIRFALFLHRSCSRYAMRHPESAHSNWMMMYIYHNNL